MRSIQKSMCAGMLALQAVVLFLVGVTLPSVTDVGAGVGIGIGSEGGRDRERDRKCRKVGEMGGPLTLPPF